ncbi:MAG: hemerythrin domain-containing protein [Candidatus Omnitrophica bacterium]|nr:hemerythrin domain-containing protein [Candidatus Omnitrophota bacterium]
MTGSLSKPKGTLACLTEEHAEIDREVHRLEEALFKLRYEGKNSLGKNLKELHETLEFFETNLVSHMALEEDVLFPFFRRHVPKLESLILLLGSEHENLKKDLDRMKVFLADFSRRRTSPPGEALERLKEKGMYFVYLLRSHLHVEGESVYRAIEKELRRDEKKELVRRIELYAGQR